MTSVDLHLSDQELLLDVDGELRPRHERRARAHLQACWKCRARRQELEGAIVRFVRLQQEGLDTAIPPAVGPRALLKARIAELSRTGSDARGEPFTWWRGLLDGTAICALLALGWFLIPFGAPQPGQTGEPSEIVSIPNSLLTPGATLLVDRSTVCAESNARNKAVSEVVRRRVFEEYGIAGRDPRAYEVDYLITPALGGADDIHNLWPHSYSTTAWNAQVKDALEDRLREMVCNGSLDLSEAQREIASNWIAAYKKYFHTNAPLGER